MSPNPYPLFSVSLADNSDQLQVKIKMLIKLYLKDPCPFLAEAVVIHIAALLAVPKYINDIEQRCQYRKMEMHWRTFVWITETQDEDQMAIKGQRFRLESKKIIYSDNH